METLYNANCLDFIKSYTFKELVNTRKVVIITDPPFNVNYHYNSYKDKLKEDDYYKMLKEIFTSFDIPFVVIHYPESLYRIAIETNTCPQRVVSWVYNSNTARQHRDIAFFKIKPDFSKVRQPYKNPYDKRIMEQIAKGSGGGDTI